MEKLNIVLAAELLDKGLKEYIPLNEWQKPLMNGTEYKEPWLLREVDPVSINYVSKALQVGFSISAKGGSARVVVEIPYRHWCAGIKRNLVALVADKAMKLCDFCWNNHILEVEGAYPRATINLEV